MLVLPEPDARSLHNRFCDTQSDIGRLLSVMPSTLSHNIHLCRIHTHEGADHWASSFYNIGTLTICEPDGRYFHVYYFNLVSYHRELSDLMPALQWYKIHPSISFIYKVRGREHRDPHSWPLHNLESDSDPRSICQGLLNLMPATQLYRVLPCHIDTYKITTPWESGIRNSNYITLRIQGLNG